jgi:hypothetical protein
MYRGSIVALIALVVVLVLVLEMLQRSVAGASPDTKARVWNVLGFQAVPGETRFSRTRTTTKDEDD